eukprot:5956036-Prymnesium_polylepis.1
MRTLAERLGAAANHLIHSLDGDQRTGCGARRCMRLANASCRARRHWRRRTLVVVLRRQQVEARALGADL